MRQERSSAFGASAGLRTVSFSLADAVPGDPFGFGDKCQDGEHPSDGATPHFGMRNTSSILLHFPHASKEIPESFRGLFLLPPEELAREIVVMTDALTDDLY